MEHQKFSFIANRYLQINNPISESKITTVINLLHLPSQAKVIDFGGGTGEILIKIMEKYKAHGTLVEISSELIEVAKQKAQHRIPLEKLALMHQDAKELVQNQTQKNFDCALCIGSSHAFGSYQATLTALTQVVKYGGMVVLGEGFFQKQPDPNYIIKKEELNSHFENVELAEKSGLTYLYSCVSSQDDWDHFEGLFSKAVEDYIFDNPHDPDREALREKIRNWRKNYLLYGRETLGFGLYLFRNEGRH